MRRTQITLASHRGERASQIARSLGCGWQRVRDAIHDFNRGGLDTLVAGSSRPKRTHGAFDEERTPDGKREHTNERGHQYQRQPTHGFVPPRARRTQSGCVSHTGAATSA